VAFLGSDGKLLAKPFLRESNHGAVAGKARANHQNLKDRLAKLDVTQAQFASFCGVHATPVNNWANGRTRMHPSAEQVLTVLEHNEALRRHTVHRDRAAPRGKPFAQGNPYRFGDKRRRTYVAGAQIQRAVA
jgi:DNA-binding transcriptional regulator YiaG